MKILFIGDIVGRIGRKAVAKIVPELIRKEKIDLTIANGENIAHGKGLTESTVQEVLNAQIDFITTGNHVWSKKDYLTVFSKFPVIRPANFNNDFGDGYRIIEAGTRKILIINLLGRVFMRESLDCPFQKLDEILEKEKGKFDFSIVDFHNEASSEGRAFGFYADGRVNAIIGTHRHVATNDAQILPQKSFYLTDCGMVGENHSVLGIKKEQIVNSFLTGMPFKHEIAEDGEAEFNAVILDLGKSPIKFKQIRKIVQV
jgi:hypothetical protein